MYSYINFPFECPPCPQLPFPSPRTTRTPASIPSSAPPSSTISVRQDGAVAPFAGDRRRRFRQDQYAGAPGGAADPERRRSAAHPAADVFAPRRQRDDAPRRQRAAPGDGLAQQPGADQPAVGRHLPQHRRAPAARVRRPHRPGRIVHHPRPRRFRRPDGHGAPRDRPDPDRQALSAEGHLPVDLFAGGQQPRAAGAGAAEHFPVVQRMGSRAEDPVRRLRRRQAGAERARLRRPAAVLVRDGGRPGTGRRSWAACSTMCWSTNTRTPTGCRRRSSPA